MAGTIRITGGDIDTSSMLVHDTFLSYKEGGKTCMLAAKNFYNMTEIYTAHKKTFTPALVGGLAGGFVFGFAGALAGVLASGNSSAVAFTVTLEDGRVFHGVTDAGTYLLLNNLAAAALQRRASENAVDAILGNMSSDCAPMNEERYEEALKIVREKGQASIAMLQRVLACGFNEAARMIERMEQEGHIGPANGTSPRTVFL